MSYWMKREFTYRPGVAYKGGGTSGEVSFPDHMQDIHKEWFDYDGDAPNVMTTVHDVMETNLTSNPLEGLEYTDPAEGGGKIDSIDSELTNFQSAVGDLDEASDWGSIVDESVSKLDSEGVLENVDMATTINNARDGAEDDLCRAVKKALTVVDSDLVGEAVRQLRKARSKERAQMKTQYKAGMANVNAERSSAYGLGLALIEIDFERELGQYASDFSNQLYSQGIEFFATALTAEIRARVRAELTEKQTRAQMMQASIQNMLQYKQFTVELKKALSQLTAEIKRIGFVMDQEYVSKSMNMNWKHSTWDMKVYEQGVAILGGMGGGHPLPEKPSDASSAVSGALSGAGTGAALGSAVPGLGTAVGAGIGAAAGGLAGIL